jgi:hypothetical protein
MKVQVSEASTSTSEQPLWVWRVWLKGRLQQGFCATEKDARQQADLAQYSSHAPVRQG